MDIRIALKGVSAFFDGERFQIMEVMSKEEVEGQRQEDERCPMFDHLYVNQDDGGITGDDFHGYVFFYIGNDEYLYVEY